MDKRSVRMELCQLSTWQCRTTSILQVTLLSPGISFLGHTYKSDAFWAPVLPSAWQHIPLEQILQPWLHTNVTSGASEKHRCPFSAVPGRGSDCTGLEGAWASVFPKGSRTASVVRQGWRPQPSCLVSYSPAMLFSLLVVRYQCVWAY